NLRLVNHMNAAGSTAAQMVHYAALAIDAGMAGTVACVFTDAPLTPGQSAGGAYGQVRALTGMARLGPAFGLFGANPGYALAARRHRARYGTTQDHLGAIAVSTRWWASLNPRAMQRSPITLGGGAAAPPGLHARLQRRRRRDRHLRQAGARSPAAASLHRR